LLAQIAETKTKFHIRDSFKAISGQPNLDFDGELRDFHLTTLNSYLLHELPASFTRRSIDLLSEATAENGQLRGYVKPALNDVKMMKQNENFKGAKCWFNEVLMGIGNLILRNLKTRSVVTRFRIEGPWNKPQLSADNTFQRALDNAFDEPTPETL
jgi:hypothetical protein